MDPSPAPTALRRLYRHIVVNLAVQLAVTLVGIARSSSLAWPAVVMLLGTLVLAGHAGAVFAPRASGSGRSRRHP